MKEKPILFSGAMVRAILDGKKTQTRRSIKLTDSGRVKSVGSPANWHLDDSDCIKASPYGQPGDRLWVKETFRPKRLASEPTEWIYRADGVESLEGWKPSIFMPRKASRITLEIKSIRVERLQDISDKDAMAEGVTIKPDAGIASNFVGGKVSPAQFEYYALWESINGKGSWDKNSWVWVIEFKRL